MTNTPGTKRLFLNAVLPNCGQTRPSSQRAGLAHIAQNAAAKLDFSVPPAASYPWSEQTHGYE